MKRRYKRKRCMVSIILCTAIVLLLGSGLSGAMEKSAEDHSVLPEDINGMSFDIPVNVEIIAEILQRYFSALDEVPDPATFDGYLVKAQMFLQEVEATEGLGAVEEYLEWAEGYLEDLESGAAIEDAIEEEGERACNEEACCGGPFNPPLGCLNCTYGLFCVLPHTGICTGCNPAAGVCDGWSNFECVNGFQTSQCPCFDLISVYPVDCIYNDNCIVLNRGQMTNGVDLWSCLIEKQDCGCDYGCYETNETLALGGYLSACTNTHSECGNEGCYGPSASEGATCKVILPCLETAWPLVATRHCRGYNGVWDPDDGACVTCSGARQAYKLADGAEKCIEIGHDANCVNTVWQYLGCIHDGEGYCDSACGADAACDELWPGSYCGSQACPQDYCSGNIFYDYPDTCSKTCSSGCGCASCACSAIPYGCDDGNPCTDDSCDPVAGCLHTNNSDPCDDGNACTTGDTCSGGGCSGGPPPDCDDQNICTDDGCDPATGCVYTDNEAPCDDGNPCTTEDTCSGGNCAGGPPFDCDDNNICTDDDCDPATGCIYENNTNACDDGDVCTVDDRCREGECAGDFIDTDEDGYSDVCDNCPDVSNPDQTDDDEDGWGEACDCDDTNPAVNPDVEESKEAGNCADGIDNDCDNLVDTDPECGCFIGMMM